MTQTSEGDIKRCCIQSINAFELKYDLELGKEKREKLFNYAKYKVGEYYGKGYEEPKNTLSRGEKDYINIIVDICLDKLIKR